MHLSGAFRYTGHACPALHYLGPWPPVVHMQLDPIHHEAADAPVLDVHVAAGEVNEDTVAATTGDMGLIICIFKHIVSLFSKLSSLSSSFRACSVRIAIEACTSSSVYTSR